MSTSEVHTESSTALNTVKSEPRRNKRRRKKKAKAAPDVNNLKIANDNHQSNTPEELPVHASKFRRVIFDDAGNVKSTIALEKFHQQTASHRKSSKRSGCFYLKSEPELNQTDLTVQPNEFPLPEDYTEQPDAVPFSDHTVIVPVDRHMEVRVHRFPNDYESVVQYWYLNLDQLNRLEREYANSEKPDVSVTEEGSKAGDVLPTMGSSSTDDTWHSSVQSCNESALHKHDPSVAEEGSRVDNLLPTMDRSPAEAALHASLHSSDESAVHDRPVLPECATPHPEVSLTPSTLSTPDPSSEPAS